MQKDQIRYTPTHEWLRGLGDRRVRVGVTEHAQSELGDVVFVDVPEVGRDVVAGKPFGVIESVKAVTDLVSPVSGKVVEVNAGLKGSPELVNKSAESDGWMIVIEMPSDGGVEGTLDEAEYQKLLAAGGGH